MSECAFLELHVGVQINLGRLCRFVAKPKSDHTKIYTATEEGHGGCMAQGVRRNRLRHQRLDS
jgi:hypothetical protein